MHSIALITTINRALEHKLKHQKAEMHLSQTDRALNELITTDYVPHTQEGTYITTPFDLVGTRKQSNQLNKSIEAVGSCDTRTATAPSGLMGRCSKLHGQLCVN